MQFEGAVNKCDQVNHGDHLSMAHSRGEERREGEEESVVNKLTIIS